MKKRAATWWGVREFTGELAESRTGQPLVFKSLPVARVVARTIHGSVTRIIAAAESPGRKLAARTRDAFAQYVFARSDKKPTFRSLAEKYFGPFVKTAKGRAALTKKTDSLERSIRRLISPQKVKKQP